MQRHAVRWNNPPGWPPPPPGWLPPPGWSPPPNWPAAPAGWQYYVPEASNTRRAGRKAVAVGVGLTVAAAVVATALGVAGSLSGGSAVGADSTGAIVEQPAPGPTQVASSPATPDATPFEAPSTPSAADLEAPWTRTVTRPQGFPPPGLEEQSARILPPVPSNGSTGFVPMLTNPDGSVVGYSPCRPWHVVINTESAPPGATEILAGVISTMRQTTGLQLVLDGPTDEPYSANRAVYQPDRYGDRWAPILVAWAPDDRAGVAGHGGSTSVTQSDTGMSHFVSGIVAIDSTDSANDDRAALRAVLLHEFGHVLGLDHVTDPTQLMAPVYQGQPGFGAGDLAGLAAVGSTRCAPDV